MGRRRRHPDNAARQKAHRARNSVTKSKLRRRGGIPGIPDEKSNLESVTLSYLAAKKSRFALCSRCGQPTSVPLRLTPADAACPCPDCSHKVQPDLFVFDEPVFHAACAPPDDERSWYRRVYGSG